MTMPLTMSVTKAMLMTNVNVKVNGKQESPLSDDDDTVWSKARESKQRDKPCSQCGSGCGRTSGLGGVTGPGAPSLKVSRLGTPVNSKGASTSAPSSNLLIDVNGSLQSWITDTNITV